MCSRWLGRGEEVGWLARPRVTNETTRIMIHIIEIEPGVEAELAHRAAARESRVEDDSGSRLMRGGWRVRLGR
jgi:hypothetical protein